MNQSTHLIPSETAATEGDDLASPVSWTRQVRSMLDACDMETIGAAAVLCGMIEPTPSFRSTLRRIPAPTGTFTVGEVARAYLRTTLDELQSLVVPKDR